MANKKIKLEFDFDAGDVKIATDKVLTLTQQIRILKQELQKTQEGTKEFQILSNKLNETKDSFDRVNAKSRELFDVLSLIPGPIGDIGGRINGAIGLLKTFSSFSFADIKGQLVALGGDLKGILSSFANLTGITKIYTALNNALAASFVKIGVGEGVAAAGARALSAALVATGIGALIVGLGLAVNALMEFASGADEAAAADARLTAQLEASDRALERRRQNIQQTGELELLQLKKRGAGLEEVQRREKQILLEQINNDEKYLSQKGEYFDNLLSIELEYDLSREQKEEKKKVLNQKRAEVEKRLAESRFNLQKLELTQQIQTQEELKKNEEKATENRKKNTEKIKQLELERVNARKAALDALIQLEVDKENTNKQELQKLYQERTALEINVYENEITKLEESYRKKEISKKQYEERVAGFEAQIQVKRQESSKKIEEAITTDIERERKKRIASLDAFIELEIDKENTSRETLKTLLEMRMQEELSDETLKEEQKQVIRKKYAKQLEDALSDDREKRKTALQKSLDDELALVSDNYAKQLAAYDEFAKKLAASTDFSEAERAIKIKETQDKILNIITTSYTKEKDETDKKYGEFKRFDENYYKAQEQNIVNAENTLKQQREQGIITEQQYTEKQAEFTQARVDLGKAEAISKQETLTLIGNSFGQLSEIVGKDTVAGKAFAISKATIDTYQSAVAAYKALSGIPIVGPALATIAAAAAVAGGLATVKKIVAVQVPNATNPAASVQQAPPPQAINVVARRASGGIVTGPGTETSDSIPALLSNGEFVINAKATKAYRPLLEDINQSGLTNRKVEGGYITKEEFNNTLSSIIEKRKDGGFINNISITDTLKSLMTKKIDGGYYRDKIDTTSSTILTKNTGGYISEKEITNTSNNITEKRKDGGYIDNSSFMKSLFMSSIISREFSNSIMEKAAGGYISKEQFSNTFQDILLKRKDGGFVPRGTFYNMIEAKLPTSKSSIVSKLLSSNINNTMSKMKDGGLVSEKLQYPIFFQKKSMGGIMDTTIPMVGSVFQAFNTYSQSPKLAVGGLVSNGQPVNQNITTELTKVLRDSVVDRPIKTYVTATDMSSQQQFDRTIKSRSLI